MEKKPDIIIYMSDQHGAAYTSWGDVKVNTPVLESIRANGVSFEQAYTPCPLCVPARMSLMSSKLPHETGVYDNNFTLSNITPCFTHSLVEAGYETVLIGRMHFIGKDQRHGFTKRLADDMTPVSWKKPFGKIISERGKTVTAFSSGGATKLVGAGASIVSEYDRYVLDTALDYIAQEHDKPQFIVVGTFGPHCPYIADETMFEKYMECVNEPEFFDENTISDFVKKNPVLAKKMKDEKLTSNIAKGCLAAYLAQIERMDQQIGELRMAWNQYKQKTNRETIFGYVSDHGDTLGERRMYGKQTYFDKSVRIPMLFEGADIQKNIQITTPVSLLDIGPTVCELAGGRLLKGEGLSLAAQLHGNNSGDDSRVVISELMDKLEDGTCIASVMLRYKNYKYFVYHGQEEQAVLIDLINDKKEENNLISLKPELEQWFKEYVAYHVCFEEMEQQYQENVRTSELLKTYEAVVGIDDSERWKYNSEDAKGKLTIAVVDTAEIPSRSW